MKLKKYQKDILKEIPFWTLLNLIPTIIVLVLNGWIDALIVFSGFQLLIITICFFDFFDKNSVGNMKWKEGLKSLVPK